MLENIRNPFLHHKFEVESNAPLMMVSKEALLQTEKHNIYYYGKRGCGKTSALKLSDEEFRLRYPEAFGNENTKPFDNAYGLYITIQKNNLPNFLVKTYYKSEIKLCQNDDVINDISLIYFEMLVLNCFIISMQSILDFNSNKISIDDEESICRAISENYLIRDSDNFYETKLELQNMMTEVLELSQGLREELSWYRPRVNKKFYDTCSEMFKSVEFLKDKKFLRICIDDAEGLTEKQQLALNTLVRSPENASVAWSVAFVTGKFDPSKTLNEAFSNRSDDVKLVQLDNLRPTDFQQFCQRIAQIRITNSVDKLSPKFSLKQMLGCPDISELMIHALSGSKSKKSKKLLADFNESNKEKDFLGFYLETMGLKINSPEGIRRKNSAALIHLCHNYNLEIPYAGFDILIALCDGCIRDFIEIMSILFQMSEKEKKRSEFLCKSKKNIPFSLQSKAARTAAEEKLKTAVLTNFKNGTSVERFILYIGHYAAAIQGANTIEPLHNPDRGVYKVPTTSSITLPVSGNKKKTITEIIKDAEVDGYLREIHLDDGVTDAMYFRLHFRVAPYFKTSYRTYSDLKINLTPVNIRACDGEEKRKIIPLVKKHYMNWSRKQSSGRQVEFDV